MHDLGKGAVAAGKMGAALSLPSPRAFFEFLFTERLSTTIWEPGTGYALMELVLVSNLPIKSAVGLSYFKSSLPRRRS